MTIIPQVSTASLLLANGIQLETATKREILEAAGVFQGLGDSLTIALKRFKTCNPEMLLLKKKVQRLSCIKDTVLITGPTGTGKELIAQALGAGNPPFVPINMSGLPDTLIESLLFGHKAGTFTGATKDHIGLISSAQSGTIFLDEIDKMPLNQQAKLLRVLTEFEITPLGHYAPIKVDCRFVAASNRDLFELSKCGLFLEDLYWRLSVFTLRVTALRDRPEDIILIAESMAYKESFGEIPDSALDGNCRSLYSWIRNKRIFSLI